jgi:hypothetical protein
MEEYLDVLSRPILRPHAEHTREVLELMAAVSVHVSPTKSTTLVPGS